MVVITLTQWELERVEAAKKLVAELNTHSKNLKFFVNKDNPDLAESEDGFITVRRSTYGKVQYDFYLQYRNLPYVDYNTYKWLTEAENAPKKPQNVGVLNSSKIQAWIDYLMAIHAQLLAKSNERQQKVIEFKKKAEAAGMVLRVDTYETRGEINKNGLVYRVEIDHKSGYIVERIEKDYSTGNSLETFLKLADNKYTPKAD